MEQTTGKPVTDEVNASPYDDYDFQPQEEKKEVETVEPNSTDTPVEEGPSDDLFAVNDTDEEPPFKRRELTVEQSTAHRIDAKHIPHLREKKVTIDDISVDPTIFTLRGTAQTVLAALNGLENYLDTVDKPADLAKWITAVYNSQSNFMLSSDQLFEATVRKGSMWVNQVDCRNEEETDPAYRGIVSDRKGINPDNKNDKATVAYARTLGVLGLGLPNYVPLWHTGIWVKLRTPTAAAFIKLDELIVRDKVQYGTLTRGEIYNNESVLLRRHVHDFIIEHIEWTNAPSSDPDYLKSIIKVTDSEQLMLGLMQTRYPDGYPLAQVCTADYTKCSHIVEGLVDLRELSFTDENKLTAKQKRLMRAARKRITEEQLREYQNEFKQNSKSRIVLSLDKDNDIAFGDDSDEIMNGIVINIEQPSIEQDEDYGVAWVKELEENAEAVFRERRDDKLRAEKMQEQVLVSYFKTYGSWVTSIEVYENGLPVATLTEPDELDAIFAHLSSEVKYVKLFSERILQYINKNIVTVIGILNYECPNCGKKHDTPEGNHHIVLPIDMLYTFFTQVRSAVRRSFRESTT